mgnify:CR=1 FL=1
MRIRQAKESDAKILSELWQRSIRELCRECYPPEIIEAWASDKTPRRIRELLRCEEFFFLAEKDGHPAGFCCGSFSLGTLALYVCPDFTGAGVGKKLLHTLEALARFEGKKSLAFHSSLNAIGFYEKSGYSRCGEPICFQGKKAIPVRKDFL